MVGAPWSVHWGDGFYWRPQFPDMQQYYFYVLSPKNVMGHSPSQAFSYRIFEIQMGLCHHDPAQPDLCIRGEEYSRHCCTGWLWNI